MIPAGVLKHSAPLTGKIVGSHDVDIGKKEDSDISYGVSDGMSFVGFNLEDNLNYNTYAPCFGRKSDWWKRFEPHNAQTQRLFLPRSVCQAVI